MCSYKMDILYALAQNEQIWSVEKINLLKNCAVSNSKKSDQNEDPYWANNRIDSVR